MALAVAGIIIFLRRDGVASFVLLLPALAMLYFGFYYLDKQKTKRINQLFLEGQLVKNLSYAREEFIDLWDLQALISLIRRSKERMSYSLKVNLPVGDDQMVTLRSEKGYSPEFLDTHPVVDVLIDPNDFNNYYLDFNLAKPPANTNEPANSSTSSKKEENSSMPTTPPPTTASN